MILSLVFFNLIDGGLSWYLIVHLGIGFEGNPIMAWLMSLGTEWFLGFKFLIFPPLAYFLYKKRHERIARFGIISCFLLYGALMIHFAINIGLMLSAGIL